MIKRISISFFFLLITCFPSFSQGEKEMYFGNNISENSDVDSLAMYRKRVLVVPFELKMYMSEIDRELSYHNGLEFDHIRNKFRKNLNDQLVYALTSKFIGFSMLNEEKEVKEDLKYIYYSIGYSYDILVKEEEVKPEEKKATILVNKIKKKENPFQRAEGIDKGEIISNPDNEERFMGTSISNPSIFDHLQQKYNTDIIIFINQMDIKRSNNADVYSLANNSYNREIKVHYTIMDIKGKTLKSSAEFAYFTGDNNEILNIIGSTYPILAKKIVSKISEEKESEKISEPIKSHPAQNTQEVQKH